MGISPFFEKTPDLKLVFPFSINEVAQTLAKLKINGWSEEQAKKELEILWQVQDVLASDLWLYYAIHHAHKKYPNASRKDICSFATLCESFFTGFYGGFGTEFYEKERKIENQGRFLLNRLAEITVSDLTKAKILLLFMEDKYFAL